MGSSTNVNLNPFVMQSSGSRIGRHVVVSPENSGLQNLHYARIVGTATSGPIEFQTGGFETVLICVQGRAFVLVADDLYELACYDTLYIPREMDVRVDADGEGCDLVEAAAPVTADYPVQLTDSENACMKGPDTTFLTGTCIKTGRISAGISFAGAGGWMSPLGRSLNGFEQVQVYFDFPPEGWGVALHDCGSVAPELVSVVHPGDCVAAAGGRILTIAAPGSRIGFVWLLSAYEEGRQPAPTIEGSSQEV
jgi:hypothetical protein